MSQSQEASSSQKDHAGGQGGHGHAQASTLALAIGALGIVYGDIGTSPLYAVKECFHHIAATRENVFGILSLVTYSIVFVVVVKYLVFVVRADNNGEGGEFALLALVAPKDAKGRRGRALLILLALFGASMLYGDGMITPAISVLSAVEGLGVATHKLDSFVVPITCGILVGLFLMQRHGTKGVGAVFGPATFIWFLSIAAAGLPWIIGTPEILGALNPAHAVKFFIRNRLEGFLVLGSVVLCITGGEALYADMGHFGKKPIRLAWFTVVFPALLVNYYGQGAMLLQDPGAGKNPFYSLVQGTIWLYPMVAIATVATVVASQALISGVFSLTRQAVQLGYFPRVTIIHTSGETEGQIYLPEVNYLLMVSCVALVLGFKESTNLAAAYGIAVTATMAITSVLFYVVARDRWGWNIASAGSLLVLFLIFDLSFFGANVPKVPQGGWFPIAVALVMFTVFTTWNSGRNLLWQKIQQSSLPLDLFMADLAMQNPHRVRGTAVFMTSNVGGTPGVLLHHFKHNQVLHEQVVLLSILTDRVPDVPPSRRVEVQKLEHGFWTVVAHYGFMQTPNVPDVLKACRAHGLESQESTTSYYLGRESLLAGKGKGLARWRKFVFAFLSRNAKPATAYFGIPPNRVVELGAQIEL